MKATRPPTPPPAIPICSQSIRRRREQHPVAIVLALALAATVGVSARSWSYDVPRRAGRRRPAPAESGRRRCSRRTPPRALSPPPAREESLEVRSLDLDMANEAHDGLKPVPMARRYAGQGLDDNRQRGQTLASSGRFIDPGHRSRRLQRPRAAGAVPHRPGLAGRGDAGGAGAHRPAQSGAERVLPRRRRRGAARRRAPARRAGSAARRPARSTACRSTIKDLILTRGWPTLRGSRTVDPRPGLGRRRAGHRAAARGRRGDPRQDDDARVRLQGRDQLAADRHHAQSVEPGRRPAARRAARRRRSPPAWARCRSAPTAPARSASRPRFCGIFGLKPTFGRVPAYPLSPFGTRRASRADDA